MVALLQSLLGQAGINRRLGLQNSGRNLPLAESIQPVMVVSSVANLQGDPYEARGIFSGETLGLAGRFTGAEIQANSVGGLLIEQMQLGAPAGGGIRLTIHTVPQVRDVIGSAEVAVLNVGGVATTSRAYGGHPFILPGAPIPSVQIADTIVSRAAEFGPILVPPGAFLSVITDDVNIELGHFFLFHEIGS